jgi:uncharacterized cupin superfamily protein
MRTTSSSVRISFVSVSCLALGAYLCLTQFTASADDNAPPKATMADAGKIARLDSKAAVSNFQPMNDFAVKGHAIPSGAARELFAAANSGLRIGVWEGGPGILRLTNYPHDEYCVMISGEVVVTDAAGHKETFRSGDSFVIPHGFSGSWDMKTKMRKQYAMVQPAG